MRRTAWSVCCLAAIAAAAAPAPKPEQAIVARHRALTAALVAGDVKKARTFYAPEYVGEAREAKVNLNQSMAMLEAVTRAGVRTRVKASLSKISVKGDRAAAIETADITLVAPDGTSQTRKGQRSEQRWRKVKGVWKLAYEKSL